MLICMNNSERAQLGARPGQSKKATKSLSPWRTRRTPGIGTLPGARFLPSCVRTRAPLFATYVHAATPTLTYMQMCMCMLQGPHKCRSLSACARWTFARTNV